MGIIKTKLNGRILRIKDCRGLSSIRGLMFDNMKYYDGALIYSNSIWMPFVKFSLTLLFLDKNFRIVKIQDAMPLTLNPKTWKVYSCRDAKYCLEIKTIQSTEKVRKIKFF